MCLGRKKKRKKKNLSTPPFREVKIKTKQNKRIAFDAMSTWSCFRLFSFSGLNSFFFFFLHNLENENIVKCFSFYLSEGKSSYRKWIVMAEENEKEEEKEGRKKERKRRERIDVAKKQHLSFLQATFFLTLPPTISSFFLSPSRSPPACAVLFSPSPPFPPLT